MFRRRPRQLLYVPLTGQDFAIRNDVRYRLGAWLSTSANSGIALALIFAIGLPLGVVASWWEHDFGRDRPSAEIAAAVLWAVAVVLVYAWWFSRRQNASETRRGYSFYLLDHEPDGEVAEAKAMLMSFSSSEQQREEAVELLLSRGACSPPGQPLPDIAPRQA